MLKINFETNKTVQLLFHRSVNYNDSQKVAFTLPILVTISLHLRTGHVRLVNARLVFLISFFFLSIFLSVSPSFFLAFFLPFLKFIYFFFFF